MTKDPNLIKAIKDHPQSFIGGLSDHLTGRRKSVTRGAFVLRIGISVMLSWRIEYWEVSEVTKATVSDGILYYWMIILCVIWLGSLSEQKRVKKIAKQAGVSRLLAARYS